MIEGVDAARPLASGGFNISLLLSIGKRHL